MICSPPGSSVPGILQVRILEWVAMPFLQGIFPTCTFTECSWVLTLRWCKTVPKTCTHSAQSLFFFFFSTFGPFSSVQSLSRVQLFATPGIAARPGLPVHHQLLEFTQTHVHRVSDAIQTSHPLSSPPPPAPNPSQNQSFPMSQLFP